jgi:hypothetical protein
LIPVQAGEHHRVRAVGLYTGPGGGLYTGPGGGLYAGPCANPYRSNLPPRESLLEYLQRTGQHQIIAVLLQAGF